MDKKLFRVIKWNGETEYFQPEKLLGSLKRSGASDKVADRVLHHIVSELEDGMKTETIYQHAFELLKKTAPVVAARYDLKKAIMRLGPSGYPFEKFIGHMWELLGYSVKTGVMMQGKCIDHEVDVVAEKEDEILMMECKYHNIHTTKSDIKAALYVHARMEDLEAFWKKNNPDSATNFKGCLVTNTKFSSSAITYAECVGLHVISWSYPPEQALASTIDRVGLHPLTCLTSLPERHMKTLLNQGYVLCKDIPKAIDTLSLPKEQREKIIQEALEVCQMK